MHRRPSRLGAVLTASLLLTITVAVNPVTSAPAVPPPVLNTDYCLGECSDILPPGRERRRRPRADPGPPGVRHHAAALRRPARPVRRPGPRLHRPDRRPDQHLLQRRAPTASPPPMWSSTFSPRSDVTIVRDKALGIPHVTGTTRAGTMYGAGYAGRRGPAVPDGPDAARGPRQAHPVRRRRRGQPGARAERLAQLAVHRGRPAGADRHAARLRARAAPSSTPTCSPTSPASTSTSTTAWPPATAPASTC